MQIEDNDFDLEKNKGFLYTQIHNQIKYIPIAYSQNKSIIV